MGELEKIFKEHYPNVEVIREASGSVAAAKKITDLHRKADILAVAGYEVITKLLFPANHCTWYIGFATNEMVLAYTERSKYSDIISEDNWFEILGKTDVTWGHSDPELDPAGYRTLFVLQLSELYYNKTGLYENLMFESNRIVRPKSVDLLSLLETGQIDYAFEYKSVALQHNLKYLELPPQINLGHEEYRDFYSNARLSLENGMDIIGEPIIYGVTIPENAPNKELAEKFLKVMLSEDGRKVFKNNYQPIIYPFKTNDPNKLPDGLKIYNYSKYGNTSYSTYNYFTGKSLGENPFLEQVSYIEERRKLNPSFCNYIDNNNFNTTIAHF